MNIEANKLYKIAKNAIIKYMHSTDLHLSTLSYFGLNEGTVMNSVQWKSRGSRYV
jgi:hypothetical protein